MSVTMVTPDAGFHAGDFLSKGEQRKELSSLRGQRRVTIHLTANDGNVVSDFVVRGHLGPGSGAALFRAQDGAELQLPVEPQATSPINIRRLVAGHASSDPLSLAQTLLHRASPDFRLIHFSLWLDEFLAASGDPVSKAEFLAHFGVLLGVTLHPVPLAVPSLHRASCADRDQRTLVAILLAQLSVIGILHQSGIPVTDVVTRPAELAISHLLAKRWRGEGHRAKDADELERLVVEEGRRVGSTVEALELRHYDTGAGIGTTSQPPAMERPVRSKGRAASTPYVNRQRYIRGRLVWTRLRVGAPRRVRRPDPQSPAPVRGSPRIPAPSKNYSLLPNAICGTAMGHGGAGWPVLPRSSNGPGASGVVRVGLEPARRAVGRLGQSDRVLPTPVSFSPPFPTLSKAGRSPWKLASTTRVGPHTSDTSPHGPCQDDLQRRGVLSSSLLASSWPPVPLVLYTPHAAPVWLTSHALHAPHVSHASLHGSHAPPVSSHAPHALHAPRASRASHASHALRALHAPHASHASHVPHVPHASHATQAPHAPHASHASPHASHASHAPPASHAPHAPNAGSASAPRLQPAFIGPPVTAPRRQPVFLGSVSRPMFTRRDFYEGTLEISKIPISGGMAQPFAACGHRCRKLAPSVRTTDIPLARTTSNQIDIGALARDGLGDVLAPITDSAHFEALFNDDAEAIRKRPLSRGMYQHRHDLTSYDVVEPVTIPLPSGRRRPVAERFLLVTWCGTFLVEKKNGTGRFIIDARPINRAQRPPPDMGLPRMGRLIRDVLKNDLAAKTDGVSYFYQFTLAPSIRPYFKIRLAGGRGRYAELQLKRMPMGWKYAPTIAQNVSNHLVDGCGHAWLDDFLVTGRLDNFAAHRQTFLDRLRKYNVEVDNYELQGSDRLRALGLDFDLAEKRFRLDPAWVDKRVPVLEDYLEQQRAGGEDSTARNFLETMGVLIWSSYVREIPLWAHAECLAALSSAAAHAKDLEQPFQCPAYCIENLAAWIDLVRTNEWTTPVDQPPTYNDFIFSDASDSVAAYIKVCGDEITAGEAWRLPPEQKIFLSEVEAIVRGAATADLPVTLFGTDNQAAHYAIRKGHSSSYVANVMLRRAFGLSKPWSCWVPTHLQPADRYTRGIALPRFPCPVDRPVLDAIAFTQSDAKGCPNSKRSKDGVSCVPPE